MADDDDHHHHGRFDHSYRRRKYFLTPGFPSGIPYMSDITTT
jgi:hypothetical protein